MIKGKLASAALATILLAAPAYAQCYGTGNFRTCNDSAGNSYNIQQYGNTTYMQGNNARTGSNWSQNSTSFGNTTIHSGQASNGNSWSMTEQSYGGITSRSGTDSDGNYFSQTCTAYGCD
jgi:hypothetical protein